MKFKSVISLLFLSAGATCFLTSSLLNNTYDYVIADDEVNALVQIDGINFGLEGDHFLFDIINFSNISITYAKDIVSVDEQGESHVIHHAGDEVNNVTTVVTFKGDAVSYTPYGHNGLSFDAENLGTYSVAITAKDTYAYGKTDLKQYFYSTYDIKVKLKDHAPVIKEDFVFDKHVLNNGKYYFPTDIATSDINSIITYSWKMSYLYNNSVNYVPVSSEGSGGDTKYYVDFSSPLTGLVDNIGTFIVEGKVTNSAGVNVIRDKLTTKYSLQDDDAFSKDQYTKASNWRLTGSISESGIVMTGDSLYKGCLSFESGIKLTLDLHNIPLDGWTNLTIEQHPVIEYFFSEGTPFTSNGIYYKFKNDGGYLKLDVYQAGEGSTKTSQVESDYLICGMDQASNVTLQFCPYDLEKYPNNYDLVETRVNGELFNSISMNNLVKSEFYDDEGFTYISSHSFGINMTLKAISTVDRNAPIVTLDDDIPSVVTQGESVSLPFATAFDLEDGIISAKLVNVLDADGNSMIVINNRCFPNDAGDYIVTYSATDSCGNVGYKVCFFEVKGVTPVNPDIPPYDPNVLTGGGNVGLIVGISVGSVIFLALLVCGCLYLNKKYK